MLDDLKHSLRALRRTPMSSLAAICILAVAIGASAAVFSVVDKVIIRPLPFEDADRVVVIWPRARAGIRRRLVRSRISRSGTGANR